MVLTYLQGIFNLSLSFSGIYGLYRCTSIILPPKLMQAGHKQFLTNISLFICIIQEITTFISCSWYKGKNEKAKFLAEEILLPISLVLESVVTSVYWPLRIFFTHLIFQKNPNYAHKSRNEYLPLHIDMCLHLFPFIGMLVNFYYFKKDKFVIKNNTVVLSVCYVFGLAYILWLKFLIPEGGKYPYPFLDIGEPYKTLIMLAVTNIGFAFLKVFQWLKKDTPVSKTVKDKKEL